MKLHKYLFNWKYRYFYKKIKGMKRMIEDEKFSRFKTFELREEVRQEYDQERARLAAIDLRIKNKAETIKNIGEGEFKKIEDEKVLSEKRIEALKNEMTILTEKTEGSKPTNQHPEGLIGNTQTIEKLYELIDYVRAYINRF